jgi:hypothetical protein
MITAEQTLWERVQEIAEEQLRAETAPLLREYGYGDLTVSELAAALSELVTEKYSAAWPKAAKEFSA